jgi:alkylation response protein AidB-like acyl-CoA dehydrogenase
VDVGLTQEQIVLRDTTARFIRSTCPLERVRELAESKSSVDSKYLLQAAEVGWFAMLVLEEQGGGTVSGRGLLDAALIAVERGRHLQPAAFVPTNVVAWLLATLGSEQQQATILSNLVKGESKVTWAVADASGNWEPGAGAHVDQVRGGYSLSGQAGLVQDAHLADWLLTTAKTDTGMKQLLVPGGTSGLEITRLDGLDITRTFCTVDYNDVQVPASAEVGESIAGGITKAVERQFQIAIVLSLSESLGAMQQDFDLAVEYATARTAFGRPIGSFQAVKHLLADTGLLLEISKALVAAATVAVDNQTDDASEVVSIAKAFVGDCCIDLAQNCFQVFGGIGFTWEHDQHLYLRRLTVDAGLYGDSSWHRERLCQIHDV